MPPQISSISIGKEPTEGRKSIPIDLSITNTDGIIVDLVPQSIQKQFGSAQTIYIDNADNAFKITAINNITGQRIIVAPNSQGYYHLLINSPPRMQFFAETIPATVKVQILNFLVDAETWSVISGGGSMGTVTSVGLALPASVFTVTGSPVVTAGTLTGTFVNQVANTFFAGPSNGAANIPAFRTLVAADLPAGTGTVTSVGLVAPNIFNVSGSPVNAAGNLTLSLANQGANTVWAGPAAGGAVAPSFRALVAADIPVLPYQPIFTAQNANLFYAGPSAGAAAIPTFRLHTNNDLQAGSVGNTQTWIPTIDIGGSTVGISYTIQEGTYSIIGNRVFVDAIIVLSSKGVAAGNVSIHLPFTASNVGVQIRYNGIIAMQNANAALSFEQMFIAIAPNANTTNIFYTTPGGLTISNIVDTNMTNTTVFRLAVNYPIV